MMVGFYAMIFQFMILKLRRALKDFYGFKMIMLILWLPRSFVMKK